MSNEFAKKMISIGKRQELRPGGRFSLTEPDIFWFIQGGCVDIFLTTDNQNTLHFFYRIPAGHIFIGNDATLKEQWSLIGRICSNAVVYKIPTHALSSIIADDQATLSELIDEFIIKITKPNIKSTVPKLSVDISEFTNISCQANTNLYSLKGVRWIQNQTSNSWFIGDQGLSHVAGSEHFPLTMNSWYQLENASEILITTTGQLLAKNHLWDAIQTYLQLLLNLRLIHIDNEILYNNVILFDRISNNQASIRDSINKLKESYDQSSVAYEYHKTDNDEYNSCQLVAEYLGIQLKPLSADYQYNERLKSFKKILAISKIFYRKIKLKDNWYKHDYGPLIAFTKDNLSAAILPTNNKEYFAYDKNHPKGVKVTAEIARNFSPYAYQIYPNFSGKTFSPFDMLTYNFKRIASKIPTLLICCIITSSLGILVPVISSYIFDNIITSSDKYQLLQISLVLLATTFSVGLFEITKHYVLLNIESQLDCDTHGIFWDRIFKLPLDFFRKYSSGELVSRISNLINIRLQLGGASIIAILNALFSISSILVLLYYQFYLALFVLFFILMYLVISLYLINLAIKYEMKSVAINARIFGLLSELIVGISKVRMCGAEFRAFNNWVKMFSTNQRVVRKAQKILVVFNSFAEVMPLAIISSMYIGISLFFTHNQQFSTGNFMAFNIALGQIVMMLYSIITEINRLIKVVPMYSKAKDFIESPVEIAMSAKDPQPVFGEIELNHISFKHQNSEVYTLRDVHLHIQPGDYIAIAGQSGEGKSTIIKLLLGFDKPTTGRIYYDNRDLADLDVGLLRQEIGVVLQHDQLMPGDIFRNISGMTDITIDEAWHIAEMCGIASDINAMPMKMNTMISTEGSGLSGGQRQRILIARAIARNPKILILDEATRALDNISQKIVTQSLAKMSMTRIVVAHRLSTLKQVNKILVLHDGLIAEIGTYEELIDTKGIFYQLVQKQML